MAMDGTPEVSSYLIIVGSASPRLLATMRHQNFSVLGSNLSGHKPKTTNQKLQTTE